MVAGTARFVNPTCMISSHKVRHDLPLEGCITSPRISVCGVVNLGLASVVIIGSLIDTSSSSTAGSGTSNNASNSASGLVSTLVPVAASAVAFTLVFLFLRAKKRRVYLPRTYLPTLHENERSPNLPDAKFGWLAPFRKIPDEFILDHQSLDGYLYLRYFGLLAVISFVGCLITWPVLFPVNATGGGGQEQLDILSFSNVANKNRYYAHVFIAWIYLCKHSLPGYSDLPLTV
ncbi:hypothetical protein CJF30_00007181 [Rutstroemia sp. NJR-2017a BBW]|nr:hypothetical protein CJF30_00007181 [Rutstroemia sp. NJR-2017a BBW]